MTGIWHKKTFFTELQNNGVIKTCSAPYMLEFALHFKCYLNFLATVSILFRVALICITKCKQATFDFAQGQDK